MEIAAAAAAAAAANLIEPNGRPDMDACMHVVYESIYTIHYTASIMLV